MDWLFLDIDENNFTKFLIQELLSFILFNSVLEK